MIDANAQSALEALVPAKISGRFGERFVAAHDDMETYTRIVVRQVLPEIFGGTLPASFTKDELLATGVVPAGETLAAWVVAFLASFGDLKPAGDGAWRADFSAPLPDRAGLRERAIAENPSAAAAYSIVDRCRDGAVDFLHGRATGEAILFSLSALTLWFDYFDNRNYLYEINNRIAAMALADALAAGRPKNARIAEFGGGSGSAALAFVDEVDERGGAAVGGPFEYVFTEPMAAFGRRGERNLRSRMPEGWSLSHRAVDLNRSLLEQGFEPESVAAAWAVNTYHVAQDLEAALLRTREILEPGGAIVIGECVRPFAGQVLYTEFIFEFLSNFRDVKRGPFRTTHGFLTPEEWIGSLGAAGFTDVRLVPDIVRLRESYPRFFTAAIVARRP